MIGDDEQTRPGASQVEPDERTRRMLPDDTAHEPAQATVARPSQRERQATVVTHASTRIAYDPVADGIAAVTYPIRPQTVPESVQHFVVSPPRATTKRTRDMSVEITNLRRKLLVFVGATVIVTFCAVAAIVMLMMGV